MSPASSHGVAQRVAVIGSREYRDLYTVGWFVRGLPAGSVVISGGARGVDRAAAEAAKQAGHALVEHLPDYGTHGKRAPLVRNALIVEDCDRLVAFWDGASTGTMHTVGLARKAGKPVEIIEVKRC